MFIYHAWFRIRLLPMLFVWILAWSLLDITQSSLRMAIWRAMGRPIRFELAAVETLKAGKYMPWRCDDDLNDRATLAMRTMDEGMISSKPPAPFVYRLLVFAPGLRGPVHCYSMAKNPDGTGTLTCKRLDAEPSTFMYEGNVPAPFKHTTESYQASKAVIDKALQLTKDAGRFYDKNNRSYWCIPRYKHYLLEFNLDGKKYYYDAQGTDAEDYQPALIERPPNYMLDLENLSKSLKSLPTKKSNPAN